MKMNYKQLGLYVLAGIISGGLCTWMWSDVVSSLTVKFNLLAIIFAISILVAGRHISNIKFRSGWFSAAILIAACAIGWHFAYEFGYEFHTHDLAPIGSSAIGGICVAIGLALAWKLNRPILAITGITIASVLGGLLLIFIGHFLISV